MDKNTKVFLESGGNDWVELVVSIEQEVGMEGENLSALVAKFCFAILTSDLKELGWSKNKTLEKIRRSSDALVNALEMSGLGVEKRKTSCNKELPPRLAMNTDGDLFVVKDESPISIRTFVKVKKSEVWSREVENVFKSSTTNSVLKMKECLCVFLEMVELSDSTDKKSTVEKTLLMRSTKKNIENERDKFVAGVEMVRDKRRVRHV